MGFNSGFKGLNVGWSGLGRQSLDKNKPVQCSAQALALAFRDKGRKPLQIRPDHEAPRTALLTDPIWTYVYAKYLRNLMAERLLIMLWNTQLYPVHTHSRPEEKIIQSAVSGPSSAHPPVKGPSKKTTTCNTLVWPLPSYSSPRHEAYLCPIPAPIFF